MTKRFIKRNIDLSLEFDRYLYSHPNLFARIPTGAHIVITVKGDEQFNKDSRAISGSVNVSKKRMLEAHKAGRHWSLRSLAL